MSPHSIWLLEHNSLYKILWLSSLAMNLFLMLKIPLMLSLTQIFLVAAKGKGPMLKLKYFTPMSIVQPMHILHQMLGSSTNSATIELNLSLQRMVHVSKYYLYLHTDWKMKTPSYHCLTLPFNISKLDFYK